VYENGVKYVNCCVFMGLNETMGVCTFKEYMGIMDSLDLWSSRETWD
jgi:hypothetical protein